MRANETFSVRTEVTRAEIATWLNGALWTWERKGGYHQQSKLVRKCTEICTQIMEDFPGFDLVEFQANDKRLTRNVCTHLVSFLTARLSKTIFQGRTFEYEKNEEAIVQHYVSWMIAVELCDTLSEMELVVHPHPFVRRLLKRQRGRSDSKNREEILEEFLKKIHYEE